MKKNINEETREKLAKELEKQRQMEEETDIDILWLKPFAYVLTFLVVVSVLICFYFGW